MPPALTRDSDTDEEQDEENAEVARAFAAAVEDATKKRKRDESALDEEFTQLQAELLQNDCETCLTDSITAQDTSHTRLLELQVQSLLDRQPAAVRPEHADVKAALQNLQKQLQLLHGQKLDWSGVQGFCREIGGELRLQEDVVLGDPGHLSVLHAAAFKGVVHLDVMLPLPEGLLREKDHLNHRYHAKRAAYLSTAVAMFKALPQVSKVEWQCLRSDGRRPVAMLWYNASGCSVGSAHVAGQQRPAENTILIRLIPACPANAFKLQRLGLERNSLRTHRKPHKGDGAAVTDNAAEDLLPTPFYNHGVIEDILYSQHMRNASQLTDSQRAAATLLRVWLRAHGLRALEYGGMDSPQEQEGSLERNDSLTGPRALLDGMTRECGDAVVMLLKQQDKLVAPMSPLQMFRLVLQHLANEKLWLKGQRLQQSVDMNGVSSNAAPPSLAAWLKVYPVVLLDASGWFNLTSNMTTASVHLIASCAERSLQALSSQALWPEDVFSTMFLQYTSVVQQTDYWYTVLPNVPASQDMHFAANGAAAREASGKGAGKRKKAIAEPAVSPTVAPCPYFATDAPAALGYQQQVSALSARGLGDRALLCHVGPLHVTQQGCDPAVGAAQPLDQAQGVLLCIRASGSKAMRILDIGPDADDAAAVVRFREFWGEKSELRRFKDGRICEAVVWERPPGCRHLIPDDIVSYVLRRHLPAGGDIAVFAGALDNTVRLSNLPVEYAAVARQMVNSAYEKLQKALLALDKGLPLALLSVQPMSSHLRQTQALQLVPHPLAGGHGPFQLQPGQSPPRCLKAVDLCCKLEASGRWPSDPKGYAATKQLMAAHIAASLGSSVGFNAIASRIGTVHVLLDGFAFCLHFTSERDEVVQQEEAKEPPLPTCAKFTYLSAAQLNRENWLHGLVTGVSGQFPSFSPACALSARWLHGHHLGPHVAQQALELLMIAVYKAALTPRGPPSSPMAGFLALMQLLASFPFRERPLVVDVDGELSSEQLQTAWQHFQSLREERTAPGVCIVTPCEPLGCEWSAVRPSPLVTARLKALALRTLTAALRMLQQHSLSIRNDANWCALARSSFADYDVVLLFDDDAVATQELQPGTYANKGRAMMSKRTHCSTHNMLDDAGLLGKVYVSHPETCKSVIRCIPAATLASKGPNKLRQELLIGFDPVQQYVAVLQQRYGRVAEFFWDVDCPVALGVKWLPTALKPQALHVASAHLMRPVSQDTQTDRHTDGGADDTDGRKASEQAKEKRKVKKGAGRGKGAWDGMVVLDIVRVVQEFLELGMGLVAEVQ